MAVSAAVDWLISIHLGIKPLEPPTSSLPEWSAFPQFSRAGWNINCQKTPLLHIIPH
jgi:hypothetical protein